MGCGEVKREKESDKWSEDQKKKLFQLEQYDSEIASKFSSLKREDPKIVCPASGDQINRVCLNHKCKNSLRCSELGCNMCGKATHPLCNSVELDQITEMINDRLQACKDFMRGIFDTEQSLIDKIHRIRMETIDSYSSHIFEKTIQRGVQEIYEKKNLKALTGKEAYQLCQRLMQGWKDTEKEARIKERYETRIDKISTEIRRMEEDALEAYLEDRELTEGRDNPKEFDSNIIKTETEEGEAQIQFLKKSLYNPKNFQLLFRASEHGFSAKAFHQKCDGINDTLTIVRTQHGKTVAGYSHYRWDQVRNGNSVKDFARRSCLMHLDLKEKYMAQGQNSLIYNFSDMGPTFGNGHDLQIADLCNSNNNSVGNFPCTYNRERQPYKSGQESWQNFSGAISKFFRIEEYEVYHVEWGSGEGIGEEYTINPAVIFDIAANSMREFK